MSAQGFFANDPPSPSGTPGKILIAQIDQFLDGTPSFDVQNQTVHLKGKTKSGRVFCYDVSKYRFGPNLSRAEARSLAFHIATEKFKPADWDWQHSREQAIEEIRDSLFEIILQQVESMRAKPSG